MYVDIDIVTKQQEGCLLKLTNTMNVPIQKLLLVFRVEDTHHNDILNPKVK